MTKSNVAVYEYITEGSLLSLCRWEKQKVEEEKGAKPPLWSVGGFLFVMSPLLVKLTSDDEANEHSFYAETRKGAKKKKKGQKASVSTEIIRVYCCFLNMATTERAVSISLASRVICIFYLAKSFFYARCLSCSLPFYHYNVGWKAPDMLKHLLRKFTQWKHQNCYWSSVALNQTRNYFFLTQTED